MATRQKSELRQALDWGKLLPLRIKAKSVADGVYAGVHRSARRGAGVEFGGHRAYVHGDDLRFIDRGALMRHGRLLIREFETETDRALRLVVDASASMAFRSKDAPAAKLAYAALVAAALARVALASGDPVSLDWIGGDDRRPLPATGGREAFERVISALESVRPGGDVSTDLSAIERSLAPVARHARRGTIIVLLSDMLDLPDGALERFAALGTRGRILVAVRVLDPVEATFPFEGPVRLRALEGGDIVETDGQAARDAYLEKLDAIAASWKDRLTPRGGHLVLANTADDPVEVVQQILNAPGGLLR